MSIDFIDLMILIYCNVDFIIHSTDIFFMLVICKVLLLLELWENEYKIKNL
jgi:hypothetical protein